MYSKKRGRRWETKQRKKERLRKKGNKDEEKDIVVGAVYERVRGLRIEEGYRVG